MGLDIDPRKVETIRNGTSPIVEPGLRELVKKGVDEGRLTATDDYEAAVMGSDISLVCVGTPSLESGRPEPGVHEARLPADGRRHQAQGELSRRGLSQHDPPGHGRDRAHTDTRARVREEGGRGIRSVLQPRVPARGVGREGLLPSAEDRDRRGSARQPCRRRDGRAVLRHRGAEGAHGDKDLRDGQVRGQLLPRSQGQLRQRDRESEQGAGHIRQPQGDGHLLPGHAAQSVALLHEAGFRLRRLLSAQGPAGHRAHEQGDRR